MDALAAERGFRWPGARGALGCAVQALAVCRRRAEVADAVEIRALVESRIAAWGRIGRPMTSLGTEARASAQIGEK